MVPGNDDPKKDPEGLSIVDVDQFYGIEIEPFSAKIAETALWMMDHLMNRELSSKYKQNFRRIPIKKKPNIVCRDALEIDWNDVIPNDQCDYILGNPPFLGADLMEPEQKKQTKTITNSTKLDYVSNWFVKAIEYIPHTHTHTHTISTNCICCN